MKAIFHRIVGASLVLLTVRAAAQVPCSVDALGGLPGVDPVVIAGDSLLPPDCTVDFGDREVIVRGTVRALDLTLIAGKLTVAAGDEGGRPGGSIEGGPGTTTLLLKQGAVHDGSLDLGGALLNDGVHGGTIDIEAAGGVHVGPLATLEASAKDPAGHGGFISIDAGGDAFLDDGTPCHAVSGELAELNGEVAIVSRGTVTLKRGIEVSGGTLAPGVVRLDAAAGLSVAGPIAAGGRCASGICSRGGVVKLSSASDLDVLADIDASGADGAVAAGDSSGGTIKIDAAGNVVVSAKVLLSGGESSRGGTFEAFAGGSIKSGGIDATGRSDTSSGGFIIISAGKDVALSGKSSAAAGSAGEAGSIRVSTDQLLDVEGSLVAGGNFPTGGIELVSVNDAVKVAGSLSTEGLGDFGTGGPIGLFAVTGIDLDGSIQASGAGPFGLGGVVKLDSFLAAHLSSQTAISANGDSADPKIGEGGTIDVRACVLTIDPGARLEASGQFGGGIFITTSDGAALPGIFTAAVDGIIQVEFPTDLPPDLGGATFTPDPVLVATDSLPPCAFPTPCDAVTDLACNADGSLVNLTWSDSPTITGVQVLRDGAVVATMGPGEEGFSEGGLAPGTYTYVVQASCRGRPAAAASCDVTIGPGGLPFRRGDCNASGDRDISDGVTVLSFLFLGAPAKLKCEKACDCNDDGQLDVSDGVFILAFLFSDPTKIPPPPFERCGLDGKPDNLSCETFGACPR